MKFATQMFDISHHTLSMLLYYLEKFAAHSQHQQNMR